MTRTNPDILYKQLIEHMNEAVWMGDEHERTVYANPKFCEMMGFTVEQMLGKESYEFWDEESSRRVRHVNQSHRKKGVSSSYEGNLKTKDGELIPVLLSGTPLPDGGTIGIMTDLRGLKEKEERERILSGAVAQANDAIIVINENGRIESWNKGAKILFGYAEEDIVGQSLQKILGPNVTLADLQTSATRTNVEAEGMHKNGKTFLLSARLTPVLRKKGAEYWLFITRDISVQRKFEEELTSKFEKLRSAYNQFGIIRRQMDYVFDLVELAGTSSSVKELGDYIVNAVIMLTRIDASVLRLYDAKSKTLKLLASFGLGSDWKGKASIPLVGGLAAKAFAAKSPLRVIDVAQEPMYQSPHLARKNGLSSLLLIPLIFRGNLVGTLSLYVTPERKLELYENEFLEKFAHIIAMSLGADPHAGRLRA